MSSINWQLEGCGARSLLAVECGEIEKPRLCIARLPGKNEQDPALTAEEEIHYLAAAQALGKSIEEAYSRAFAGICTKRGKEPILHQDPDLLRDLATMLADCGLRPEDETGR